jgi:single stranded DNA-binding protein
MARSKRTQIEQDAAQEQERPKATTNGPRSRTDTNLVVLTGRLGTDPEMRYVGQSGAPVAEFRIASSRAVGIAEETREETSWITVKCWNRQGKLKYESP